MMDMLPWIILLISVGGNVFLYGVNISLETKLDREKWRHENCDPEFPGRPDEPKPKKPRRKGKVISLAGKG